MRSSRLEGEKNMFNIHHCNVRYQAVMALNYQEGHFHNERWFSLTLDLLLTLPGHSIDELEM